MNKTKLPKLVVFDLDCTLWPFHVDTTVTPPFKKTNGNIVDIFGKKIKCYPEAPEVLNFLSDLGCDMAVASRTSEIEGAYQLIKLFGWEKFFKYKEIYPGCKVTHFNRFKKLSKIDFEEMLFFDDERRNIVDLTKLNVTCIFVKNGMTLQLLKEGLNIYAEKTS